MIKGQPLFFTTGLLVFLLAGLLTGVSNAGLPDPVKVSVFEAFPATRTLVIDGPFQMHTPLKQQFGPGQYKIQASGNQLRFGRVRQPSSERILNGHRLLLEGTTSDGLGVHPPATQTRPTPARYYRGTLEVILDAKADRLRFQNRVPAQEYVMSVVGSETNPDWPMEAMKAQAVLTQTRLSRQPNNTILSDTTQDEAYLGHRHVRPAVQTAVTTVWGQRLTYHQHPIEVYYHGACGGKTSPRQYIASYNSTNGLKPRDALAKNAPYLVAKPCQYCQQSPFQPIKTITLKRTGFEKAFGAGLPRVMAEDSGGRPTLLTLGNGESMSGYAFWIQVGQRFGWDKVPGTRYHFAQTPAGDIEIRSNGAGHGVGLCQWGASTMAKQGKTYRQILEFYFPGSQLQ